MFLFAGLTEFLLIRLRRFYKHIKSTLGLYTFKAGFPQSPVQKIPVPVIGLYICRLIHTTHNNALHQGRSIDRSHDTVCDYSRIEYLFAVCKLIRDHQISDTLSRQGKGFAVRIADDRIMVKFRHIGNLCPVICQLSVRLVRNQYDLCAKFLFLFCQDFPQTRQYSF